MKTYTSRQGYDLYAPEYRKDHPHLDSFDWAVAGPWIKAAALECLQRLPLPKLAELGCGDGRLLGRLERWDKDLRPAGSGQPVWQLSGSDLSPAMLQLSARKAKTARLDTCDLSAPGWADRLLAAWGRQDVLLCFFVLVHLTDLGDFFRGARRLLAPGGRFFFNNIPQREGPVLEAGGHQFRIEAWHHSDGQVRAALQSAGLVPVRSQTIFEGKTHVSTVFEVGLDEGTVHPDH